MRLVIIFYLTVIFFIQENVCFASGDTGLYSEYKVELVDFFDLSAQADFYYNGLLFGGAVRVDFRDFESLSEKFRLNLFFRGPDFVAGNINFRGIIKEFFNPLSATATSGLYTERFGFSLNRTASPGQWWGLGIDVLPGRLNAFSIMHRKGSIHLGSVYRTDFYDYFFSEILCVYSVLPQENEDEQWQIPYPVIMSQNLTHVLLRTGFRSDVLRIDLSSAFAFAPFDKVSRVYRVFAKWNFSIFTLLGSVVFNPYIFYDPLGEMLEKQRQISSEIQINPISSFLVSMGFYHSLDHTPAFPGQYIDSNYSFYSDIIYINSDYKLKIKAEYIRKWDDEGFPDFVQKMSSDLTIKFDSHRLNFQGLYSRQMDMELFRLIVKGLLSYTFGQIELTLGVEYTNQPTFSGRLKIARTLEAGSVFMSFGLKDYLESVDQAQSLLSFSLGLQISN